MRWGDYIKRTAVRRVVWIVVGLAVYAVLSLFGVAQAQVKECTSTSRGCTASEALAWLEVVKANRAADPHLCSTGYTFAGWGPTQHLPNLSLFRSVGVCKHSGGEVSVLANSYHGSQLCAPGEGEWREDLMQCFDPSECFARNQQPGFGVPTTRPWRDNCIAGCKLAFDSSQGIVCTTLPNGSMSCAGSLQWTGDQCSVPPGADPVEDAPPTRPDQATCTPAGSGQSFCIKPSGEQCYSASNGREVCWRPNETGEKSDRDVLQKRNAGNTEIPPANPNLPNGDVLEKSGQSITTDTTRTQGNTSTTTTTTTTNYVTQYGTNPGAGDQGAPDDGSGGAEGGEGDSESGSIDGGGDCETPPVGRGGDAQLVAVVNQAWATRCAVEAGNAAKVTGDVADCSQPFTVEGDNANAHKLRAMREQICGESARGEREGISSGLEAEINAMEGEHSVSDIWGDGSDAGSLVTTRYGGGGSCPRIEVTIPIINQTWTAPPQFCSLIAALRLLFIAVATVWGLRIIGS